MHVVLCVDKSYGYAKNGQIPWHNIDDRKRFRSTTTEPNRPILLMGRKTFESMPSTVFEDKRHACVLSSTPHETNGNVTFCTSIDRALFHCKSYDKTFLIGGGDLVLTLLERVERIDLTVLDDEYECDQILQLRHIDMNDHAESNWWNKFHSSVELIGGGKLYTLYKMDKVSDESKYLELMRICLTNGIFKPDDRTGVGRHSIFGHQLRFDLTCGFPLLTTKKVFWKGVVQELIWFLNGETDVKKLQEVGVHIWDGNSTREYMDSIGITDREEGDIGPCYGWQWRHFGAEYETSQTDYTGQGVDQLYAILKLIKHDKSTSRAVMSAWNPPDLASMNLPPCHVLYQFSVHGERLCCHMYQRSADVFLGLPFNIASSALLCHIMASMLEMEVGTLHVSLGDAHVYNSHVEQCFEQITRIPRHPCNLKIVTPVEFDDLSKLSAGNFQLEGYEPHPAIKGKMAV